MIIGMVHQQDSFNSNDALFNPDSYRIGEDLQYPFEHLRALGKAENIEFCTIDKYPPENYDAIICLDPTKEGNKKFNRIIERDIPIALVLLESVAVQPNNYNRKSHARYSRIFTWNDDLVDNEKYFLLRLANKIPTQININLDNKRNAAVMIASNKHSSFANELYSKRLLDISWCLHNNPTAMDLFGMGWDEYEFKGLFRKLNRFPTLKRAFGSPPKVWKGKVKSKKSVLEEYKFSIAYENVSGINGYVTEKLFDSMFSLCVPVYLGAQNIKDLVPKECFIDRTEFASSKDLFDYLLGMSEEEYKTRICCIEQFIFSNSIKPFSAENFAETLLNWVQEIK